MVFKLYLFRFKGGFVEGRIKVEFGYFYGDNYVLFMEGRIYFVLGDLILSYIVDLFIFFLF